MWMSVVFGSGMAFSRRCDISVAVARFAAVGMSVVVGRLLLGKK